MVSVFLLYKPAFSGFFFGCKFVISSLCEISFFSVFLLCSFFFAFPHRFTCVWLMFSVLMGSIQHLACHHEDSMPRKKMKYLMCF